MTTSFWNVDGVSSQKSQKIIGGSSPPRQKQKPDNSIRCMRLNAGRQRRQQGVESFRRFLVCDRTCAQCADMTSDTGHLTYRDLRLRSVIGQRSGRLPLKVSPDPAPFRIIHIHAGSGCESYSTDAVGRGQRTSSVSDSIKTWETKQRKGQNLGRCAVSNQEQHVEQMAQERISDENWMGGG
ncbi:hypothetical protein PsorP6_012194 [Peronosclerospora sorghi]|uniref:Uncharacterized protein n=1 Tax=Peronosclerospora sorghi TaxID=230839 RepID=A0ACC0WIV1_9STRA|nr:hypothetical protein PsorP6_012194 [Peronosclerospora sorghi]